MVSLWGVILSVANNLHEMTTHQMAVDHNHHDEFSLNLNLESVFDTNLNQARHTYQNATGSINNIRFVEQILPRYKC